jgi:hypothetical protein
MLNFEKNDRPIFNSLGLWITVAKMSSKTHTLLHAELFLFIYIFNKARRFLCLYSIRP